MAFTITTPQILWWWGKSSTTTFRKQAFKYQMDPGWVWRNLENILIIRIILIHQLFDIILLVPKLRPAAVSDKLDPNSSNRSRNIEYPKFFQFLKTFFSSTWYTVSWIRKWRCNCNDSRQTVWEISSCCQTGIKIVFDR